MAEHQSEGDPKDRSVHNRTSRPCDISKLGIQNPPSEHRRKEASCLTLQMAHWLFNLRKLFPTYRRLLKVPRDVS